MSTLNYIRLLPIFVAFLQLSAATPSWHVASDGNSYLIEGDQKCNWLQAHDQCARLDLQLVVIDSAQKNSAFDALLRKVFARSTSLWLGYHDEFNREKSTARPFYTLSNGNKITFSNWGNGEPNNNGNDEHCAHIYSGTDFKWNDMNCENHSFGYVCEKHHLTNKYNNDLEQRRKTTYEKNSQISAEFSKTQTEIKNVIDTSQRETDTILIGLIETTDEIVAKSRNAINDIVQRKPYMQAVIADVGDDIREILLEAHNEIAKASNEARQSIASAHLEAGKASNEVCGKYANKLSDNTKAVDKILGV